MGRALFVLACFALTGCNAPRKCIDGKVYEDTQGDGVFTEVWIPLTAETVPCAVPDARPTASPIVGAPE